MSYIYVESCLNIWLQYVQMPSKHHSIVFYSSTLEVALCKINKKLFKDTPTMVVTHKHWGMIVNLPFILANSLFLSAFKTSVSPLSKKNISRANVNIKDISYQQHVFPLQVFHNIRFSSHFFLTFESIRVF